MCLYIYSSLHFSSFVSTDEISQNYPLSSVTCWQKSKQSFPMDSSREITFVSRKQMLLNSGESFLETGGKKEFWIVGRVYREVQKCETELFGYYLGLAWLKKSRWVEQMAWDGMRKFRWDMTKSHLNQWTDFVKYTCHFYLKISFWW